MLKLPADIVQSVITCASFGGAFEVTVARAHYAFFRVYRTHPDPTIWAAVGGGSTPVRMTWTDMDAFKRDQAPTETAITFPHDALQKAHAMMAEALGLLDSAKLTRQLVEGAELEREAQQMRARMERQGVELDSLREALGLPADATPKDAVKRALALEGAARRLAAVVDALDLGVKL